MTSRGRIVIDLALIALTALAGLLSLVSTRPLSAIAVFAAALTLPGAVIVTRIPLPEPLMTAGLVIGLSLAIDVVIGLALIWTRFWHPVVAVVAVALIACALLARDAAGRREGEELAHS